MKGWQIFRHSFNLVINNLEQALRLSLVLYLVQFTFTIYSVANPIFLVDETNVSSPVFNASAIFPTIVLFIISVVASLWIAVAWHRFALTGEVSTGWLPRFRGRDMLRYFAYSILIAIICFIAIIVVSVPIGLIGAGLPAFAVFYQLLLLVSYACVFVLVGLRLGVVLPAVALGETLSLSSAWNATKGEGQTLLALAGIGSVAAIIVSIPSLFNNDPSSIINLVYSLVINWFATIIGISVLTTLYGHFVENRPIN